MIKLSISTLFAGLFVLLAIAAVWVRPSTAWANDANTPAPNQNITYLAPNSTVNKTILNTLASNPGNYSIFVSLSRRVGLLAVLANRTGNARTVFAPNNAAFEPYLAFEKFFFRTAQGYELLQSILYYHILPTRAILVSNLTNNETILVNSLLSSRLEPTIQKINTTLSFVDYANITIPDVKASNGVIQGINEVLLPVPFALISGAAAKALSLRPTPVFQIPTTAVSIPSFTIPTVSLTKTVSPAYPTMTHPYY